MWIRTNTGYLALRRHTYVRGWRSVETTQVCAVSTCIAPLFRTTLRYIAKSRKARSDAPAMCLISFLSASCGRTAPCSNSIATKANKQPGIRKDEINCDIATSTMGLRVHGVLETRHSYLRLIIPAVWDVRDFSRGIHTEVEQWSAECGAPRKRRGEQRLRSRAGRQTSSCYSLLKSNANPRTRRGDCIEIDNLRDDVL
jgi:hypothetical protein